MTPLSAGPRLVVTLAVVLNSAVIVAAENPIATRGQVVIGFEEQVAVGAADALGRIVGPLLAARIDTGAETSSIDARQVTLTEDGGRTRATFHVPDDRGRTWTLDATVVRWVQIRRAGAERQRRPVVSLSLCLAGQTLPAEFTLTDRSGQDARVLVGRAALAGRFLVAPDLKDTQPEACSR